MNARFWSKVSKSDEGGCWLWTGAVTSKGYGSFFHQGKIGSAHRVSYVIHNGEIPKGQHVLHVCDVPLCVRPDHLMLGDHQENMRQMFARGRRKDTCRGERIAWHKLTDESVGIVFEMRRRGASQQSIADRFGVAQTTVGRLLKGQTWRHVHA